MTEGPCSSTAARFPLESEQKRHLPTSRSAVAGVAAPAQHIPRGAEVTRPTCRRFLRPLHSAAFVVCVARSSG